MRSMCAKLWLWMTAPVMPATPEHLLQARVTLMYFCEVLNSKEKTGFQDTDRYMLRLVPS